MRGAACDRLVHLDRMRSRDTYDRYTALSGGRGERIYGGALCV